MAQHASEQPTLQRSLPDNRAAQRKARSRRKGQNGKKHADVPRLSWTISEWCAAHDISRSSYEKMKRENQGPRELRSGKIVRITPAANDEWMAAREVKAEAK